MSIQERKGALSMKKILVRFGMVALVGIATALGLNPALPQQASAPNPGTPNPGNMQVMSLGGVSGADRLTFLTKFLALTPTQQEQAKAILDDEKSALQPLVDQMKEASAALDSAEKTAAADGEIDQLASNLGSIFGQMLGLEAKAASKVYAQLTARQKQKLDQFPRPEIVPVTSILGPMPVMGGMTLGPLGLTETK